MRKSMIFLSVIGSLALSGCAVVGLAAFAVPVVEAETGGAVSATVAKGCDLVFWDYTGDCPSARE